MGDLKDAIAGNVMLQKGIRAARLVLISTWDLLATALLAVILLWGLRGAFVIWEELHPELLVDARGFGAVAVLWTVAWVPTILVCAMAVFARILFRRRGPIGDASPSERAVRHPHDERPACRKAFIEFPPRRGVPTGVRSVDLALLGKGWSPGLNGILSSGLPAKAVTAFLLASVGAAQKSGLRCAWVGASLDRALGERMGVDVSAVQVLPPEDEDPARAIEIAHGLAASLVGYDLVVIESLAPLDLGRPDLEAAVDAFVTCLQERGAACVYVDGSGPVPGAEGFSSLCSYSTTRLVLSEDVSEHDDSIQDHRIKARVHKGGGRNGYAATFDLVYDRGITDDLLTPWSLVHLGVDLGALVVREGEGVFLHTEMVGFDERDAKRHLANDPELAFELQLVIRERINRHLDLT